MSTKKNQDIRQFAKDRGVKQWEIADKLGCTESVLCRKMRLELPEKEKIKIIQIINDISSMQQNTVLNGWTPIDVMAPEFRIYENCCLTPEEPPLFVTDDILVCTSSGEVLIASGERLHRNTGEIGWISHYDWADDPSDVAYWMPLPKAPGKE